MSTRTLKVTLADLARDLGVSIAAVSMALRNHPRVSRDLAVKAQQRAEEMGYQTNPMVRTLMAEVRRGRVASSGSGIAFLHGWPGLDPLTEVSPTYSEQLKSIIDHSASLGYRLEIHNAFHETAREGEQLSRMLWTRGLSGVIIGPRPETSRCLRLDWNKFAVSTIGHSLREPRVHRTALHTGAGLALALPWVRARGLRRLGLAQLWEYSKRLSHPWIAAWAVASIENPDLEFLPWSMTDLKNRENAIVDWVNAQLPEAVFTSFADECVNLEPRMHRPPVWIDIATSESTGLPGPLHESFQLGKVCVDLVVQQMQRNETGLPSYPQTVLIEPNWSDGEPPSSQITSPFRRTKSQ